jgi:hypothetical protein
MPAAHTAYAYEVPGAMPRMASSHQPDARSGRSFVTLAVSRTLHVQSEALIGETSRIVFPDAKTLQRSIRYKWTLLWYTTCTVVANEILFMGCGQPYGAQRRLSACCRSSDSHYGDYVISI